MKLNKTVYLEGGGLELCEYDTDDLSLSGFWIFIFVVSLGLNVFAIIGNLLVVVACFLQSEKEKIPLFIYIHALAFSDLFYALIAPLYTYRYVLQHWPKLLINFGLAGRLSHHATLIGNTFSSISSWLVVALTIDRVILTRLPTKTRTLSTRQRARIAILIIILLCCAVNSVWIYEFFEVPIRVLPCNGYWIIPKEVSNGDGSAYIPIRYRKEYQIYAIVSAVLFMYALPTIIMVIGNIFILLKLNSTAGALAESSGSRKRRLSQIRLTKMTVVVSVMFMVCNMPDIATRLLWKFVPPLIVSKVQPIAHLFLMMNVGANFIVYSLFNKQLFKKMIKVCKRSCWHRKSDIEPSKTSETSSSFSTEPKLAAVPSVS